MKSTAAEIEVRIHKVVEWIVGGNSKQDIVVMSKELWGVGERQVEKYLFNAREKIVKEYKEKMDSDIEILSSRLDFLYKKALEKGDLKTALQVLGLKEKYFGIVREYETSSDVIFINNIPE